VLSAGEAAAALARGFERAGVGAVQVPVADGGDGTMDAVAAALGGEWRTASVPDPLGRPVQARWLLLPDGRAVVESAEPIGLWRVAPEDRDPLRASSRGLGELIAAALDAGARGLLVGLGGVATVDGGRGLREVIMMLPNESTITLCDVMAPLLGPRGAAHAYGPQKGATPAQVDELERRLASSEELLPFADLPGAGAAGGLGAAFAGLGARLVPGADYLLETVRFRERVRQAALVVTGEGTVDETTAEGKAPGAVLRICREEGVRCVVFGGRVIQALEGAEMRELSGEPARAREDLAALGEELASRLLGAGS
jgi:glycerate 2-kinase